MKINFALLGLASAQSGDDRWEDTSYDYDIGADRWSNENQYSLDEANAGITFGVMARVTKQQNAKHFQKALKLSCWNSNMIRDMNNDNKFSVYFNDQVEYKRFHPGVNQDGTDSGAGGRVDTTTGRDDLSWLYAVGDLRTGYNHQYGFEHNTGTTNDTRHSDPYFDRYATDTDRMGGSTGSGTTDGRNNNRLRQMNEDDWTHSFTSGAADLTQNTADDAKVQISNSSILVSDGHHSVRPDKKWTFRKWGYQSDNVERAESNGYAANNVVYHFGHHDNTDNLTNRPNMRYGVDNGTDLSFEGTSTTQSDIDKANMSKWEFDFHGFKDDWRYSLRMGGCLYEAARWVYDESSFHRTGRLTYTDDTLFMDDPFNPADGTDIFGAHEYAAHVPTNHATLASDYTTAVAATVAAAALYPGASTCDTNNNCGANVITDWIAAYKALADHLYHPDNIAMCSGYTLADQLLMTDGCLRSGGSTISVYTTFTAARDAIYADDGAGNITGCFYDATATPPDLYTGCAATTTYLSGNTLPIADIVVGNADDSTVPFATWTNAVAAEAAAQVAVAANEFTIAGHTAATTGLFADIDDSHWNNAGSDHNANNGSSFTDGGGDYLHGNCNGTNSCENINVATPSSGGVFADVHWVHVFNAHIFPLQDVGYYQYDQSLGLINTNTENDSITSRDGYGYNIYTSQQTGKFHVMRDVWGADNTSSYIDTANNAPDANQLAINVQLAAANVNAKTAFEAGYTTWIGTGCFGDAHITNQCKGYVTQMATAYEAFAHCVNLSSNNVSTVCDGTAVATTCFNSGQPCYNEYQNFATYRDLVWTGSAGCFFDDDVDRTGDGSPDDADNDGVNDGGIAAGCSITSGAVTHTIAEDMSVMPAGGPTEVITLLALANSAGAARAAVTNAIPANQFHSQYGTLNIGNLAGHEAAGDIYSSADRPFGAQNGSADFVPILTKTRRKIEDFNVVMANPTYEGHGFLNFVATYHDHTENYNDSSNAWIRQVGKRFLSTIGGLTTASNDQRNVCRALKDGIDSYRMNNIMPGAIDFGDGVGGHRTHGHDDPYLAPLGPGPAGNYGNGQRCGAAMYENFGDWFLRPAQTYSAYNTYTEKFITSPSDASDGSAGWGSSNGATAGTATEACTADSDDACFAGLETYNYWAFILSEGYDPILPDNSTGTTYIHQSKHELWRNGSMHYDRQGLDGTLLAASGRKRRQATYQSSVGIPRSSGRGFAISSFPHNELGKDFRFNIRTLHNMGNGVAKQFYQIQNLASNAGNEITANTAVFNTLRTSNLRTSETVWSYYFYAVDTIKIAFPEFVARVNHCDSHLHRGDSHCLTEYTPSSTNGNPEDDTDATNGLNELANYPGYKEGYPKNRLGFQDIIIDGVTMKKTDNQYDSRATSSTRTTSPNGEGNWHKQYHFARGLREDDHTRATLHYLDTEFANEDGSLNSANGDYYPMCSDDMNTTNMSSPIYFYDGANGTLIKDKAGTPGNFQGYSDSYQPLKPCASWCAIDEFLASNMLNGKGVDNSKQTLATNQQTVTGSSSLVSSTENFSKYGGICGRVLRIDGLLQTYDELHNRQYGTIQEIWVQLQYAYQESLDNSDRTLTTASGSEIRKVQSPFPNVFFSAPEVVDIRGFCPSSNMKCRGYMSDQHQPYGGAREHIARVHWNNSATRGTSANAFGSNQVHGTAQSGNDWTLDRDFRGDSKWPWNYHSYIAGDVNNQSTGLAYGGTNSGTRYVDRDENFTVYQAQGKK